MSGRMVWRETRGAAFTPLHLTTASDASKFAMTRNIVR